MEQILTRLLSFVLKLVVLVAGLVVFLSLLSAAVLLAALWGMRALWARVTGQPVTPWVMGVDPRTAWRSAAAQGFRRRAAGGSNAQQHRSHENATHEAPLPPQTGSAGPLMRPLPGTEEVTDVQPRRPSSARDL